MALSIQVRVTAVFVWTELFPDVGLSELKLGVTLPYLEGEIEVMRETCSAPSKVSRPEQLCLLISRCHARLL